MDPSQKEQALVRVEADAALVPVEEARAGRVKAGWAHGHGMTEGLPVHYPDWLFALRARTAGVPRIVHRGKPGGPRVGIDWGQSLQRWLRHGYVDASWVWQKMPLGTRPLMVLWDISGSMASYVEWYFPWLHRLAYLSSRVHIFAFGVDVENITPYLRRPYREALREVRAHTSGWGSGTAIGHALRDWNAAYQSRLRPTGATVAIISDGWDVGAPDILENALCDMTRQTHKIIWINPLMATSGFEPRTRALLVARHYVEKMTAGASVDDLRRLTWDFGFSVL